MDILRKIQRDEMKILDDAHRKARERVIKMDWVKKYGNYYVSNSEIYSIKHIFNQSYDISYYDDLYTKFLLRIEMNKLSKLKMFKKGERKRISTMVHSDSLRDLAKVIINKMRNDRIRKYGRNSGI